MSKPPADADERQASTLERFFAACADSLARQRFERLLLAGYRGPQAGLQRVAVPAIALRGEPALSFVFHHDTRDVTKNHAVAEGLQQLRELIGTGFANAHLFTRDEELQLAFSRKGRASLRTSRREAGPMATVPATHNIDKRRMLTLDRPFLHALGVTDAQGRLVPAMSRKWKQINKFLEVFSGALAASPLASDQPIEVLDFGAGKGYLTFALHDHLQATRAAPVQVTGVELRADLVALCNGVVEGLALQGLGFELGDVSSVAPRALDVMIALHACDTATDHAIHMGIRGGASIILCAPCCHKQLRPQLLSPHPLRPLLQHGVHLGQEAEMLTDGLRALLLDACGYATQVFEFVSLEHTAKNKMILAVKRPQAAAPDTVLAQVRELKGFYGIREQCLETLLRSDALI